MTTPRNIKASVINDLRTYAIHRKHMEKSEMSEIKDYGEPWAYNKDRTPSLDRTRPAYQDRDGKTIPGKSTYADDGSVRDRAMACVNALAGRDPEKLEALLEEVNAQAEAYESLRYDILHDPKMDNDTINCVLDYIDCYPIADKLRSELAAFEGRQ